MLGRGALGEALCVADVGGRSSVAPMRVLKRLTASTDSTLINALDQLTQLNHPHLLPICDVGVDSSTAQPKIFYTRAYLPSFVPLTNAAQTKPLGARLRLIGQMLGVLAYLHRRGQLHRNLKPSNVCIVQDSVRVMDFGLSLYPDVNADRLPIPTLSYIAPEQLEGSPASPQTDLYAVGLILYELMTGRFPYQRNSAYELIANIRLFTPNPQADGVSPELADLISRWIAKDPAQRPRSAVEAIRQLEALLGEPLNVISQNHRFPFIPTPQLQGRDAEIAQLETLLTNARDGIGGAAFFSGPLGIGKTALLHEMRRRAVQRMAVVLSIEADPVDQRPYALWRPLVRCLTLLEQASPAEVETLRRMLNEGDPVSLPTHPDELLVTIIGLLPVLATSSRPFVLLLDDLHHADHDSLWLLHQLLPLAQEHPIIFVGTYEAIDSQALDLPTANELRRLSVRYISGVSQQILGDAGELPIVNALFYRETDGNPYFLMEVMRALAEQTGSLEDIGIKTLPNQLFTNGLKDALTQRLELLDEGQRELLAVLALDTAHLNDQLLIGLLAEPDLSRWLLDAHEASILIAEEGGWRFAHAQLQQVAHALLDDTQRKEAHLRLATLLVEQNASPERIALHYERADRDDLAFSFALRAAHNAFASGAAEAAISRLERLLDSGIAAEDRARVLLTLAEAYLQVGDTDRSERTANEALTFIIRDQDRAQALLTLAKLDKLKGDLDGAERRLHEAAAQTDPTIQAQALIALSDVAAATGAVPQAIAYGQQALATGHLTPLQQLQALQTIALAHADQDELAQAVQRLGQVVELAEQTDIREQARTLTLLAGLYFLRGGYEQAQKCFSQRLQIAISRRDLGNAARALGNLGRIDTLTGQLTRAETLLNLGLRIARFIRAALTEAGIALNLGQLYLAADSPERALTALENAVAAASLSANAALQTQAELYRVVARTRLEQLSTFEALAQLTQVATHTSDEETRALVDYWRWKLDPAQTEAAQRAAAYYAARFLATQNAEMNERYAELTGQRLPAADLPPLPSSLDHRALDLDALVAAAAALLPS